MKWQKYALTEQSKNLPLLDQFFTYSPPTPSFHLSQCFFFHQFGIGAGAFSIGKNSDKTGKLGNIHAATFSLNCLCFFCLGIHGELLLIAY
jgi:hypothetical protein